MAAIRAYRITVPDNANSFSLPGLKHSSRDKNFIIKNVDGGLTPGAVRFNFAGDAASDYWTLEPGESSPVLTGLRGGDLIYTDGVGQSVTVEILVWDRAD